MSIRTAISLLDKTRSYRYLDAAPQRGGTKDVYASPDNTYVLAVYQDAQTEEAVRRLREIVTGSARMVFDGPAAAYFERLFCWPKDIVSIGRKTGLILPFYDARFFFAQGLAGSPELKGAVKVAGWFTNPQYRHPRAPRRLDPAELGNWQSYFQLCVHISRGLKRLEGAGLAHADFSAKNVLLDPLSRQAAITDIDELVVPGLPFPDVPFTLRYAAPEVVAGVHLHLTDPARILPGPAANRHSLAVLIYELLLRRHPLLGRKLHSEDGALNELIALSEGALFIEDADDAGNRPPLPADPLTLPWSDVARLPFSITGPYLRQLFAQAFSEGLHQPTRRPAPRDWEQALLLTTDIMLPCPNAACAEGWYVYDNSTAPRCPFCGSRQGSVPILEFYQEAEPGKWRPEDCRLVAHRDKILSRWHADRSLQRDESLSREQLAPAGYFTFFQQRWFLVNQALEGLRDLTEGRDVPVNVMVELREGKQLLLLPGPGGRMAIVRMVNG